MLAVSMAMGYAECTGKLPAVLLHSGIGTLHGSMALRNAYFAKVPMIVFSGETYEHTGDTEIRPQGWHWLGLPRRRRSVVLCQRIREMEQQCAV